MKPPREGRTRVLARQADDETLQKYDDRTKARAIRRMGEMATAIEPSKGSRHSQSEAMVGGHRSSRKAAAEFGAKPCR